MLRTTTFRYWLFYQGVLRWPSPPDDISGPKSGRLIQVGP